MAGGKHILGKPKNHRIFGTARVGERGQIVIPKEARQFYGIRPGDTVLVLGSGESGLVLSKPEVLDRVARQILEDMGRNEEKLRIPIPFITGWASAIRCCASARR